jgi:predicted DNA-binding transcriptional regulator AlpA
MTKKLITINEFLVYSGFKSKTSYYNLIKTDPLAPKPIRVGIRKVMLSFDEVNSWLESRKAERHEVA